MNSWFVARNVAEALVGKLRPLREAVYGVKPKRQTKPKCKITGDKMKKWVLAMGGTVKEKSDGT